MLGQPGLRLYTGFGFRPLWLSVALSRRVAADAAMPGGVYRLSGLSDIDRRCALAALRRMAQDVLPGLDWSAEVTGTLAVGGDTLVLAPGDIVLGGAVCQVDTLSPGATLFISLAAVRPGAKVHTGFLHLLAGVKALAWQLGRSRVIARVHALRGSVRRSARSRLPRRGRHGGPQARRWHRLRAARYVVDSWL